MPFYTFFNEQTNETFEDMMSISEKEIYLQNNPHIKQEYISAPANLDSVRLGIKKPDAGFRDLLKNIKKNTKSYRNKNGINTF
jgi:hypothetical protein